MKLQNLSKAVCKNKVFIYLLNKYEYEGEDDNIDDSNWNDVNVNRKNNAN